MTTMRERAIEAAAHAFNPELWDNSKWIEPDESEWLAHKRTEAVTNTTAAYDAILTVLMEPSEEVANAGGKAGDWDERVGDDDAPAHAISVLQAMLKAATAQ